MAGHAEHIDNKTLWGGNGSPFRISYGKQMMWFFLVSDALTFGGLLTGYGFARHTHTMRGLLVSKYSVRYHF
jgi:cytochrome c oxidase subunit 3